MSPSRYRKCPSMLRLSHRGLAPVLRDSRAALSSDRLQIGGRCPAPLTLLQVEADLLAFVEPAQAGALHRCDMDEDVLRTIIFPRSSALRATGYGWTCP